LRENVTISYQGKAYEIGRGEHFYGIWAVGSPQPQPLEWWPDTPEGWSGAWARFTSVEAPDSIAPVGHSPAPAARLAPGVIASVALLAIGVVVGIAGLFPTYLNGASLASQAGELVPHLIYLAAWAASAVLIVLGGARARVGALLGVGVSIVAFGLFLADFGQGISKPPVISPTSGALIPGTVQAGGAGLWLGLVSWLLCAAGTTVAFRLLPTGEPSKPRGDEVGPVVMLMLAGLGAAIAFAPSWDSYTLHTAAGATQSFTEGNAFANPWPVIVGNVAVMVLLVAVVATAALWRPIRFGAALLAGAIIPMVAQAISAFIQVSGPTSPSMFGISPSEAAAAGLTIGSGLTAAFWIYCAFVVAMLASCAWMVLTPRTAVAEPPRQQAPGGQAGPPFGPGAAGSHTVPVPAADSSNEPCADVGEEPCAGEQPDAGAEPARTGYGPHEEGTGDTLS
jgi:hypothetical protein